MRSLRRARKREVVTFIMLLRCRTFYHVYNSISSNELLHIFTWLGFSQHWRVSLGWWSHQLTAGIMWSEIFLWSPHALYLVPHNSSLYVSRVIHKRRAGHAPVLSRNCLVRLEILEVQLTPTHSLCGMIIMGWAPGHTAEHCWVNAAFYTKFNTLLTRIVLNNSISIH